MLSLKNKKIARKIEYKFVVDPEGSGFQEFDNEAIRILQLLFKKYGSLNPDLMSEYDCIVYKVTEHFMVASRFGDIEFLQDQIENNYIRNIHLWDDFTDNYGLDELFEVIRYENE